MKPKYKLGKFKLKNRIFLAPMEEVNDIAFRLLCKKAGAGLTWTELSSPLNPKPLNLDDKPILQIFAISTKNIKEFIKKYNKKVSGWDFNLGCPAKLAKKHGFGAYLIDLKIIEEVLKTMRQSTKKSIIVKIRKSPIAFEILKIAEKYCDAIGVHPRTKEQGYAGEPDLSFALEIKSKSRIPVIYSGNVNEKNYEKFLKDFDFVMVGRASIGHPEIFAKITKNTKFKTSIKDYIKLAMKYNLSFKQIKFQTMNFTKGLDNSRKARAGMIYAKDLEGLDFS